MTNTKRNANGTNGTSSKRATLATSPDANRPVRVAGASGGFTDRVRAIRDLAKNEEVDVIIGDWMAEMTMTVHGAGKIRNLQAAAAGTKTQFTQDGKKKGMYAETFLDCFKPAIPYLAQNKVKLAVNAGASDTELLAQVCVDLIKEAGVDLKVAWVEGDDATESVNKLIKAGEKFESLMHGKKLEEWGLDPVCAQCYLGGLGIAEAFRQGADVVICGRVADAAPAIGAAAWWHNWRPDQFDELAGSLIAGHLIECSAYVTGGYFSGFKDLMKANKHLNIGFPIAEIDSKGDMIIRKERNSGGCVTVTSVLSQLLYEIQGPLYYNSDVTASIEDVKMEQIGEDLVKVSGIKGFPPPPTTKVGITAPAGFQAEFHFLLCGLDMEEKCRWTEEQTRHAIGEENIKRFSLLKFHQNGSSPIDAEDQDLATVDFRMFAQSPDPTIFDMSKPDSFYRWGIETFLQSAPGLSLSNDLRQAFTPKPYYEYWVALLPQSEVNHRVHCLFDSQNIVSIPFPPETREYPRQQKSYETSSPVDLSSFGPTVRAPLGYIVGGRSGDKASDCNVGFYVRNADEWDWLRSYLTIEKIIQLLGPREYKGKPIDRFEMPHVNAVHFLLHDHLDRGYNACSTYDTLGKNACEYLRAKTVDIPKVFLDRGRI